MKSFKFERNEDANESPSCFSEENNAVFNVTQLDLI